MLENNAILDSQGFYFFLNQELISVSVSPIELMGKSGSGHNCQCYSIVILVLKGLNLRD